MTSLGTSYRGYRFPPAVISHVWSAPPLQGESSRRWGKPFASMYPAYWWSPGLLALMESARTDPHNAGGHDRPLTDSGWRCAGRRLGHHIKRSLAIRRWACAPRPRGKCFQRLSTALTGPPEPISRSSARRSRTAYRRDTVCREPIELVCQALHRRGAAP